MNKRAIGIFVLIIIVGLVGYLYALYDAYDRIEVEKVEIVSLEPVSFSVWRIIFKVYILNKGSIDVDVKKLTYRIYINSTFVGEGGKEDFTIKAGSENSLEFSLDINIVDLGLTLVFASGKTIDITVKGEVVVPLKLYGVVPVGSFGISYEKHKYAKL